MFTLQLADKQSILLEHCPQNPTLEFAESISIPEGITKICSKGGGSTIDVGKWLAFKYKLHHTAVPTTAGTGSEVTKYCVLVTDGKKKTYNLKEPDSYILDPGLVVSLPKLYTVSSGFDALSQNLEAHWSKNSNPEVWSYTEIGQKLAFSNLHNCINEPHNINSRMNMMLSAHFSGKAINITRTNVCHAISYPLTEWYGIPHGIACGMSLAYFAKKFLGRNLSDWIKSFNLPVYVIDLERIADEVMKNPKLEDCPQKITREDIMQSLI